MPSLLRQWCFWWREWFLRASRLPDRMRLGRLGELWAERHLCSQGFKIVARNWRHGRDEIDLVARDGVNLVFVEVKTRSIRRGAGDTAGVGYYAVDSRKRTALSRACRAYLVGMRVPPRHFRFDIVEIKIHENGLLDLQHHRGVALFPKYFLPKAHG